MRMSVAARRDVIRMTYRERRPVNQVAIVQSGSER